MRRALLVLRNALLGFLSRARERIRPRVRLRHADDRLARATGLDGAVWGAILCGILFGWLTAAFGMLLASLRFRERSRRTSGLQDDEKSSETRGERDLGPNSRVTRG